jgi:DNA-binding transcriptional ArsR family regulator
MDEILNLFNILSDKTRLRILLLLMKSELCVCEIFETLDMSQPRVSQQLSILKQSKLIKDRRVGKWIYYKIDENMYTKPLKEILPLIPDWLKNNDEFMNDQAMMDKILQRNKQCGCKISGGE